MESQTTEEKTGAMKTVRPAIAVFIVLWLITGVAYPLAVYGAGQILSPSQAQGSLIIDANGRVTGSELIGQPFSGDRYFWPRPSATGDYPYNPLQSSGSNLGPTSRNLVETISNRTADILKGNGAAETPSDLVMSSGSGLDPHISAKSAKMQASRVAKARGTASETVYRLIDKHTEKPIFGFLGQERVNVLVLNKALDDGQTP